MTGAASPPPARVLATADAVGGVWTYALDLARGLAEHGVATTLAVFGPPPDAEQARAASAVPGLALAATGLPLDWTAADPRGVREAGAALAALARDAGAELIHLNSPALAAYADFAVPVVGVCHSCLATWWRAVRHGDMPEDFRWRSELVARGYAACDLLAAPSHAFADATARAYGGPAPLVVRNGRTPAARLTMGAREPSVLSSGRLWDEAKGAAVLDAAAARLSAPVYAAGPLQGPVGGAIELKHVHALGKLTPEALAERLGRAPVFASAALYEPFGLGVLEAAQAGCALVLSDIPAHRELWAGAARLVPPGRPHALAEALQALLDDPDLAAELGEAARARAGRYTVAAMSAGVLDAYRRAGRNRRAAA